MKRILYIILISCLICICNSYAKKTADGRKLYAVGSYLHGPENPVEYDTLDTKTVDSIMLENPGRGDPLRPGFSKGRVTVMFELDDQGYVNDAEVYRGKHPLLDAEALRVVLSFPRWSPAYKDINESIEYPEPVAFR